MTLALPEPGPQLAAVKKVAFKTRDSVPRVSHLGQALRAADTLSVLCAIVGIVRLPFVVLCLMLLQLQEYQRRTSQGFKLGAITANLCGKRQLFLCSWGEGQKCRFDEGLSV